MLYSFNLSGTLEWESLNSRCTISQADGNSDDGILGGSVRKLLYYIRLKVEEKLPKKKKDE
jgi:hypothetical protein